jgi:pimeloyl-ACP methyl ester carboxylesterase
MQVCPMSSQTFILPDGKQLGYALEGEGKPVIYFHGTASSRLEIMLLRQFASENQFMLIGVDRPGYGLSTSTDRVRLRDFVADINALADHLGLGRFGVLSWSGGGPFALTYIALNPDRVTSAVAVGSPALPFNPSAAHNNNPLAKVAMKAPFLAKWALGMFRKTVLEANQDIDGYLKSRSGKSMLAEWPQPDARFFADPAWLKLMYAAMAEGFRQDGNGINAVYQEHRLFMQPWNEPIEQIPAGKLTLWQGSQDKTCPSVNAQKIAQTIEGTRVKLFPDEGHCVMFAQTENLPKDLN